MSFYALLCLIYVIAHQLLAAVTGQIPPSAYDRQNIGECKKGPRRLPPQNPPQ
jgi:hypothetical protein